MQPLLDDEDNDSRVDIFVRRTNTQKTTSKLMNELHVNTSKKLLLTFINEENKKYGGNASVWKNPNDKLFDPNRTGRVVAFIKNLLGRKRLVTLFETHLVAATRLQEWTFCFAAPCKKTGNQSYLLFKVSRRDSRRRNRILLGDIAIIWSEFHWPKRRHDSSLKQESTSHCQVQYSPLNKSGDQQECNVPTFLHMDSFTEERQKLVGVRR
jgi:hypothetical protein